LTTPVLVKVVPPVNEDRPRKRAGIDQRAAEDRGGAGVGVDAGQP
jgi:hypothetical protein